MTVGQTPFPAAPAYAEPTQFATPPAGSPYPGNVAIPAPPASIPAQPYASPQPWGAPPAPGWPGAGPVQPAKGSGLAITALVLAILAVLLCWGPIINNFSFVLGALALGFGVPALISARRGKRTGRGMATASVILSVLAFVGVISTQALYVSAVNDAFDSVGQDIADESAGRGVAQDKAVQAAAALRIGQSARVGDYRVTVTKVTPNANAIIAKANQFNDAPKNRFVLVNATVTYVGTETGTPGADLSASIAGSDGREYTSSAASVVTPLSDEALVTLRPSGSSKLDFAMDLPASALARGKVVFQESFSLNRKPATWAVSS